jgi:hypothetical protein
MQAATEGTLTEMQVRTSWDANNNKDANTNGDASNNINNQQGCTQQ